MYQKPLLISQVSHPLDVAPCRHLPVVAEASSGHVPPPLLIRIIFMQFKCYIMQPKSRIFHQYPVVQF